MNSIVHTYCKEKVLHYIFMTLPNPSVTNFTFDYTVLYCEKRFEMGTNGMEIREQKGEVSDFNRLPLHIFMSLE
jgi:hypothetical protein